MYSYYGNHDSGSGGSIILWIILLIVLLLIGGCVQEERYNHIADLTAQKIVSMQSIPTVTALGE